MKLVVFTKKEDCSIYICFEELFVKLNIEFYIFDKLDLSFISSTFSNKDNIVAVIDYESFGDEVLSFTRIIKNINPQTKILITNAPQDVDKAMQFFASGVTYYLTTEIDKFCLCKFINELAESYVSSQNMSNDPTNLFVGKSKPIQKIKALLPTIAETNCNILITGETGTGKELLARVIHQLSPRRYGPFITLDCTTLQETIFESEVFGYEKGAFTGAIASKKGLVELADGGTLFIDEIGELPLPLQKKFLRFIQEKTFMRVGGTRLLKADVRLIAATNRNLEEEVKKGNFRSDLYFRLNTLIIEIPPLRERKEDIPLLLEHFIKVKTKEIGRDFKGFSKGFLEAIMNYSWPGNVRELQNLIERALILAKDGYLTEDLLPGYIKKSEEHKLINQKELINHDLTLLSNSHKSLNDIEKEVILHALIKNNWNQTKTAQYLGISRKQLINKIKKYGLHKENITWLKYREDKIKTTNQ